MKKKRKNIGSEINTGGGAYIGGNVNTGGGNFIGRDQFNQNFQPIYDQIQLSALSESTKDDLKAEVEELQKHVEEQEFLDEGFLARRLRNIKRMAPDILDLILKSLAGPQAAAITVVQKVAARIKAEQV